MNAPPPLPQTPAPETLKWHEQVWAALPLSLVLMGGVIGGAFGGAAWAINQQVLKKVKHPVLRYVWTGLISFAALAAWFIIGIIGLMLMRKRD